MVGPYTITETDKVLSQLPQCSLPQHKELSSPFNTDQQCTLHHNQNTHLAEVDVHDPEDHGDGELGGVDGEEPLGGVHVCLHPLLMEVPVEPLHVLLYDQHQHREMF